MGFFKKVKKRLKKGTSGLTTAFKNPGKFKLQGAASTQFFTGGSDTAFTKTVIGALGFQQSASGKLEKLSDLKDIEKLGETQLQKAAITAQAQREKEEEKRRRQLRGNIFTRPLGSLVSRALLTRSLTGQ